MLASSDDHKFNDDLLLHEEDRKLASIKYPTIFYALDHPQLRQLFSKYDVPANRAKRVGLIAGLWAIGLGADFCASCRRCPGSNLGHLRGLKFLDRQRWRALCREKAQLAT
jgi:hypothetical protein